MPDTPILTKIKPVHLDLIKQKLPDWLPGISEQRLGALKQHQPNFAELHRNVPPPAQRKAFKNAIHERWANQSAVDEKLAHLNDLQAFAEPLLKAALRDYGAIDVRRTSLRLYAPVKSPWWSIDVKRGVTSRTTTVLEAALHNFSASETFADFAFLSQEDARGQREHLTFTHRVTGQKLTAERFKAVCRALDIGAQYQQHLKSVLGLDNAAVAATLRRDLIAQLRTGLNSAVHLALAKKDISDDSYALIQTLLQRAGPLQLGIEPVDFYCLDLLQTRLTGILLIAPIRQAATEQRILVYVPEDPAHPLKEYPSSQAFLTELISQLRDGAPGEPAGASEFDAGPPRVSYQQFFSQFVAHEQRGRFFAELNSLLATVRWHPRERGDSRPSWRADPVDTPNLQAQTLAIRDDTPNRIADPEQNDLWHYLYRVKLNKLVNDAREIAISTAYADRMARWEWWDNLEKILSDILNVVLLVVTPFVPVLGELMLAYTVYQVLDDVFEGIVDWAEGLKIEGWEHLLSVADNLVQLALFKAGGDIAGVADVKLSRFVDHLIPVQTAAGETRLWNPDLSPYHHEHLRLPANRMPGENGLHQHQGKQIASLENNRYEVQQDPVTEAFHIAHPKRADAYRPSVTLNGSGACVITGEEPRAWSNTRLLRRLGPQTEGLSDSELEQARVISGVQFSALRHMYANNEPTPPLLADTLKRFNSEKQIASNVAKIRDGRPLDPASDWFEQMVTELDGWPQEKALLVYPNADLSGTPRRYGNATAQGSDAVSISLADVMAGKLPEKVLKALDARQRYALLGNTVPEDEQIPALRKQLATYVEAQSEALYESHYARQETADDPHVRVLRTQYPALPLSIAQRLVRHTRRSDLKVMNEEQRVPLDVKNQARELDFETRSARMFEQIQHDKTPSTDTENLALNALRTHSDGLANLRIQVRERTPGGDMRNQVGAEDAATLRVLVRNREGQYRVFDAQGHLLHGATDFYSALFQALPFDARFNDADQLRSWLIEITTPPAKRRVILSEPPIRVNAEPETLRLLGGGNTSTLRGANEQAPVSLQSRIKRWLPQMSEQGVRRFARSAETPEVLRQLEHLEREGQALETALNAYKRASPSWPLNTPMERQMRPLRAHIAKQIKNAWEEGYTKLHDPNATANSSVRLNLSYMEWPEELPTLPFDLTHVTHLNMRDGAFSSEHNAFLQRFPNLRTLNLSSNQLDAIPPAIAGMHRLRVLDLSGNKVLLDAAGVEHLRHLSRLRALHLTDNPLGQVPDIGRMPELMRLELSNTGISEWPTGLFEQERDALFLLNLQGNPITTVPECAPESAESFIVAYARLDRAPLSPEAAQRMETYRLELGIDPHRTYPAKGEADFWVEDLDEENRSRFEALWDALEAEHGSQGFFEVIKKLERPEFFEDRKDAQRYEDQLQELRQQVRRMLTSMHDDKALRDTLFQQSSFPGLCPDAGSQIFTEMGIHTAASDARLYSRTVAEQEDKLVKLARGAARLKLLNHVVRADIAHRLKPVEQGGRGLRLRSHVVNGQPGEVDEVGVYLAYQTRLSRRLDLPWVSESMVYRNTADVPEIRFNDAYEAVRELSRGDGLVDQMLKEPYWEGFLKEHYAHDYEANEERSAKLLDDFEDLDSEQKALVNAEGLSEEQQALKRQALKDKVAQLQIEDRVVHDQIMSETLYDQVYNDLAERRKEWLREQTRLLLARTGD